MHDALLGQRKEYKASILNMKGAINPTKNRGIIWPNNTQKTLKWSQEQLIIHATLMSQKQGQKRDKGRGVSLPYARLQDPLFTTENPLDFSGGKANTQKDSKLIKEGTKGPNNA